MATDDQLTSTPSITKRPVSRKHRIVTTGNNGISRLPSLLSKSTTFLSTSGISFYRNLFFSINFFQIESMHYKTYRSRHKDMLSTSSSLKIERPTTNIISQRRLPPLNDNNQKQKSEYQRRQVCLFFFQNLLYNSYLIDLCIKSFNA